MKHIRNHLLGLMSLLAVVATPLTVSASAAALSSPIVAASQSAKEACQGIGLSGSGCSDSSGLNSLVKTIVNILSAIVGVAAVIMIIISGMRYVTSGGDAQKVSGAKSALIYAIVGLLVVAMAQILVHYVLGHVQGS